MSKIDSNAKMAACIFMLQLGIANSYRFPNFIAFYETPWKEFSNVRRLPDPPDRTVRGISFLLPQTNANNNGQTLAVDDKLKDLRPDSALPLNDHGEDNVATNDFAAPR